MPKIRRTPVKIEIIEEAREIDAHDMTEFPEQLERELREREEQEERARHEEHQRQLESGKNTIGEIFSFQTGAKISEEEIQARIQNSLDEEQDKELDQIIDDLCSTSCAFFCQEILTGSQEYGDRFFISEHHQQWDELIQQHDRLCVLAPRDHGKCGTGEELLLTPEGKRIQLVDWKGGELIAFDEKTKTLIQTYAPPVRENGKKQTLKIKLRSGREITVTENHPFYVKNKGWVQAQDLFRQDKIAIVKKYPENIGTQHVQDPWLLGLLLGDGKCQGTAILATVFDAQVLHELKILTLQRNWAFRTVDNGLNWQIGIPNGQQTIKWKMEHHKKIPPYVFLAQAKYVKEFLAGYLDSNGHFDLELNGAIEMYSTNKELLQDMQHLFSRIGVPSRLATSPRRLRIEGESLRLLDEQVRLRSYKRHTLKTMADAQHITSNEDQILFDQVDEILPNGDRMTYALSVPEYHAYCANEIINHNTYFFDYGYPLWKATTMPGSIGYIFSATAPQAERILEDIKDEIVRNPELRYLKPDVNGKHNRWSARYIRLTNGSRIYARGFGTKVRGAHPHWLVVDDGLNDETIYSETTRKKEIEYFKTAISNMIVPGGQIIVVGCVTMDTWVATENGLRQIGNLNPTQDWAPEKYHECDVNLMGKDQMQKAHKYWVQGRVPTRRVTLEGGYRLEGSYRHPFWVMGEDGIPTWRKAAKLKVGDYVALKAADCWGSSIPIRIPKKHNRQVNALDMPLRVTEELAYFLGFWTAEGSYEKTGRLAISSNNEKIRKWLAGKPFGLDWKVNVTEGSEQTLRCSSKLFLDWMVSVGVVLGKAVEKDVPQAIMGGPREIARSFLQGLFDGDGNAYVGKDQQQIMLASVSEQLIRNVQILLLNFGIVAHIAQRPPAKPTKKVPQGGKYPLWILRMTGNESFLFNQIVGFQLEGKQKELIASEVSRVRGVPHQASLIKNIRKTKPRRPRNGGLPKQLGNIGSMAAADRPGKKILMKAVEWFEQCGAKGEALDQLKQNCLDDLIWLKVRSIENQEAFTVDFVIDGDHSFITNGIVSHNTPFHAQDLYADLAENEEYHFAKYQAIDKNGQALWPERYDKERLEAKKREIGSICFTREFLCEPIADDMSLFPKSLFRGQQVEEFNLTLGMEKKFWEQAGISIYMGVDFALSSSVQADFTVIWTMGVDGFGNRWIIDIQRQRGLPYQEQLSLINQVARKYEPGLIFLEANQMQRIFGEELIRTSDLPIKQFTTGVEKHSLEKGVPSLRVLLENAKFRIPRGDARAIELTDIWIDEMNCFTWHDGKLQSVGGHDDMVMACWICDQAIRRGGFSFTFGEEEDDGLSLDEFLAKQMGEEPQSEEQKREASLVDNLLL